MTRKVVYNRCYGGFGLSEEACIKYLKLKGMTPVVYESGAFKFVRAKEDDSWSKGNIERHDPILVQVVEEMGRKANGNYANLVVEEVDGPYRIDDYDGMESIQTQDTLDWH